MSIMFKPTGTLDISTDPTELSAGDMQRCKNLRVDQQGVAKTRDGATIKSVSQMDVPIYLIVEQNGVRYEFAGAKIYRNEQQIDSGLTQAQWSAFKYNSYNADTLEIFALNGTDRKRISEGVSYEWGMDAPTATPASVIGGATGLTGAYSAKITLARKSSAVVEFETNPSPACADVTLTDQSLSVWFNAEFANNGITHARLYRTLTDGAIYYHDQDVALNVGDYAHTYSWEIYERPSEYDFFYMHDWEEAEWTPLSGVGGQIGVADDINTRRNTYTWEPAQADDSDNFETVTYDDGVKITTADATNTSEDLFSWEEAGTGTQTAFADTAGFFSFLFDTATDDMGLGDLVEEDHNRPPLGSFCIGPFYVGTCFIVKENRMYYCKPKQPEYWPEDYYIEVSPLQTPGQLIVIWNGQPYYLSRNEIYLIQGTGHSTFFPIPMSTITGAYNSRLAVAVAGTGIYHVDRDGMYLFDGVADTKITQTYFEPTFRGETTNGIQAILTLDDSWLIRFRNKVYFFYRGYL